ncbi:hypothetical protein BS50DRAFT_416256 [Corynespora cassiicola Philippines]|uniref:Uncharacterized protein n=1 Tax=Corynespora cassiicola Philippines TaxID=1448308 RepID=A0A2T2NMB5_CORCC|nr:hypothetical protein BS50DRAFT_416256 [Corynespora cassiicola Philippines]
MAVPANPNSRGWCTFPNQPSNTSPQFSFQSSLHLLVLLAGALVSDTIVVPTYTRTRSLDDQDDNRSAVALVTARLANASVRHRHRHPPPSIVVRRPARGIPLAGLDWLQSNAPI